MAGMGMFLLGTLLEPILVISICVLGALFREYYKMEPYCPQLVRAPLVQEIKFICTVIIISMHTNF